MVLDNLPARRGAFARPTGGGEWKPAMAGAMHPPFSLFLPEENEKTGRARSKREKEVYGEATGARLNEWRSQNDFPRAIGLSGGLFLDEWTSFSFRCRLCGGY